MKNKYKMSLSLNVLNHLGINLYSNIPAVLSEIVANSWDADAENVKITIMNDEIVIEDDGCGMDVADINNKFLYIGYQKRNENIQSPKFNRKYMGRKGIGKLSMFSIAKVVEIYSRKKVENGIYTVCALSMDIDDISETIGKENTDSNASSEYYPTELNVDDCDIHETGTKIILKDLKKLTTSLTEEYIKKRVARRFGIIGDNFHVFVNGTEVKIEDRDYFHKLRYLWYFGDESEKYVSACNSLVFSEKRSNIIKYNGKEYKISGWIGSVDASGDLKDGEDNINKIVVLVRGKLGQEDILSEYSEGGLYSKYLIGEINADFFDDDSLEDMATSNRQEYRRDDERYLALKSFVYSELKYIQGKWTELRNESGESKAVQLLPVIGEWVSTLQGDDKKYAKKMFGKVNQMIADDDKKKEILKYSILAFEKMKYSKNLSAIDQIDAENFEVFKEVFTGLDEIEETLYYQIIRERMEVIKQFEKIVDDEDALEKVIQLHLFNHLWLLDPSWERVEGSQYMEKQVKNALDIEFEGLSEDEKNGRLDIGYRKAAGKHIVIELKRAKRVVKLDEVVKQVSKYYSALVKLLTEAEGSNYSFEILFVVGKPIDNNNDTQHRDVVNKSLEAFNCRIVYYKELIENAYRAYNEYIAANEKIQPLVNIFSQLEEE